MKKWMLFVLGIFWGGSVNAVEPLSKAMEGQYFLSAPERGKTQKIVGIANYQGKPILATSNCDKGCPIAIYKFLPKPSEEIGKPVYSASGIYVISYDKNSLALVMPNAELGEKPWTDFRYANLYSKDAATAKGVSSEDVKNFAKDLSAKLFSRSVGQMAHADGSYFLAVPQDHLGKRQQTYQLTFKASGQKQIKVKQCPRCSPVNYQLLPKESAIIGVDVYQQGRSHYLFDLQDGVLVHARTDSNALGNNAWGKNDHYNVFASNKQYIRQLRAQSSKQDALDQALTDYFAQVKAVVSKEKAAQRQQDVAERRLPKTGLTDAALQAKALTASKRWANAYNWEESIDQAFFTSSDWRIKRHPLTGVITGRTLAGYVTMQHPDGRCRYQHTTYRQDYDGSSYTQMIMTGVGPVYDLACDNMK